METAFEKTPDELIAEILSRYSVLDLREQTDADLNIGENKLFKAKTPISIKEAGEINLIRFWKIDSNGNEYEVRRFENFVWCSCRDFFFSKTMCKHCMVTVRFYCPRCFRREVQFGNICQPCKQDTAPYLKTSTNFRPTERVGGIRI